MADFYLYYLSAVSSRSQGLISFFWATCLDCLPHWTDEENSLPVRSTFVSRIHRCIQRTSWHSMPQCFEK